MTRSVRDAILQAQKLAFAPVAFQVARVARDRRLLAALLAGGVDGRETHELVEETGLSRYAVQTLLEAGLSFDLTEQLPEGRWRLTRTGYMVESDRMTRVNMDFIHDVCYRGLFRLEEALVEGRPAGLEVFGDWMTIYQALCHLPEHVRKSWFAFDHFYSDGAFQQALVHVLAQKPTRVLDVGGNTGRFSIAACTQNAAIHITLVDLPDQLRAAQPHLVDAGIADRVTLHGMDVLDAMAPFPPDHDAIWMSQFLVCFSLEDNERILRRAGQAMGPKTDLWILDTFWDRAPNDVARYCLHGTSPYFTAMANGNSRVYAYDDQRQAIERAGLNVAEVFDGLGRGHTLLRCCRA